MIRASGQHQPHCRKRALPRASYEVPLSRTRRLANERQPVGQLATPVSSPANAIVNAPAETIMGGRAADYIAPPTHNQEFVIGRGGIIGRDAKLVSYLLDHPQVSRVHARLNVSADRVTLADLGSANGTYCNGLRVSAPLVLSPGDTIDIGPFSLEFDGEKLKSCSRSGNVQLCVSDVSFTVRSGQEIKLLQDVELVINPGEFLCILGPSGSGKSTLLNVMSGRREPSSGCVLVNNRDLHANFSALKQDLSVVPQASVMHDTLTVYQSFQFTAELRLPSDLSSRELEQCIQSAIETVGLQERKNVRIARLSGGQLKRAGLGGELLSDPTLLFLDEVTSGLDEHSDGEMMRLFRGLADGGKTLVCITHNLAHVEENCHLVAILTKGGRLAFLGSPQESLDYFRIDRLSDIYTELQTREPEAWAGAYRTSAYYERYIARRRPTQQSMPVGQEARDADHRPAAPMRQLRVLLRRMMAIWSGDLPALGAVFGQALLVAVLLCMVFGKIAEADPLNPLARIGKIRNLMLLVTVSCFWLGCNNSVKEIVKERSIYRRERDYNLIPESYLLSKWMFMGTLGVMQAWLLTWSTLAWCGVPGEMLAMLATVTALSLAGTCLGLAISANANNEELAVALVPIAVIPQIIILAGVVASLPNFSEWLARVCISAYWGQHAVNSALPASDRFHVDFDPSYGFSVSLILLHALVFSIIAWLGVRRRWSC